ncbi:MAG: MaoC/PaaZ C-terminal domain-containing protein [Halanaeroarchaeum sp.]
MSHFERIEVGTTTRTEGRTVTEADIVNFAGVSGDFNQLHTDAAYMADTAYGEPIAHGALVFSIMTGLQWRERSSAERNALVAFYGMDKLRFTAPTFPGDTLTVHSTVAEKTPSEHPDASGRVAYETEVRNQDDETVLYCEPILLFE